MLVAAALHLLVVLMAAAPAPGASLSLDDQLRAAIARDSTRIAGFYRQSQKARGLEQLRKLSQYRWSARLRILHARASLDSLARVRAAGQAGARVAAPPSSAPASSAPPVAAARPGAPGGPALPESAGLARATPVIAVPFADYEARVRAAFTPKARAYAITRTVLIFVEPIYLLALCMFLLFSGLAAWLRDLAHSVSRQRYVRSLVFVIQFSILMWVLLLPLNWYETFALEHRFGLSAQTFAGWLDEQGRGLALLIASAGVVPVAACATWLIEHRPRSWWAWAALASPVLIAALVWLMPLVIAPAFNQVRPLADPRLRSDIEALARHAGIGGSRVFEVDRSRQTSKVNAYVTGFGSSHRIVIWDTALHDLDEDELLSVVGHEIGHYALGHVARGIALTSVAAALALFLAYAFGRLAVRIWGRMWGFRTLHDLAALPLFLALFTLVGVLTDPLLNAASRRMEREADLFSLELTHLNDAAARSFIVLGLRNLSDPDPPPAIRDLLYTHPPLLDRVRDAATYRPWEHGQTNRYFKGDLWRPEEKTGRDPQSASADRAIHP